MNVQSGNGGSGRGALLSMVLALLLVGSVAFAADEPVQPPDTTASAPQDVDGSGNGIGAATPADTPAATAADDEVEPYYPPSPPKDLLPTSPQVLMLPFPFYNENFGAAGGLVYGLSGFPEPQSRVVATVFGGSRGSAMMFLAGQDLRTPWAERVFIDPIFSVGYFQDVEAFVDGNPGFPDQRAGSNSSSKHNYIDGNGWDYFWRARTRYLLPIGSGRDVIIPDYEVERGLLVSGATGATSYNPLDSGRTFLSIRPFYRNQQVDSHDIEQDEFRTNGLDFSAMWDNRDFPPNPSQGQSFRFELSRDFGLFDSDSSWTVLSGEADQYFDLGTSDWFRQQVLALNFWTASSPTWREKPSGAIANRPPPYAGATLGGLWRMRAFPSQRFSDESAIYYAAELRMIPDWNPFDNWPVIQEVLGVSWLQAVPFVEVGRVAPSYNLQTLHSSMKWDAGFGLRAMAKGFIIRTDAAGSDEGFSVQMMISQPFQF